MKVDLTVMTFILTFVLSCIILYFVKPAWVQVANEEGKLVISWPFIIVYSLIFASLMAIVVLVIFEIDKDKSSKKVQSVEMVEKTKFCSTCTY